MIDNEDDFERMYEEVRNIKFKEFFSLCWDEYQMYIAEEWLKGMMGGGQEPSQDT